MCPDVLTEERSVSHQRGSLGILDVKVCLHTVFQLKIHHVTFKLCTYIIKNVFHQSSNAGKCVLCCLCYGGRRSL